MGQILVYEQQKITLSTNSCVVETWQLQFSHEDRTRSHDLLLSVECGWLLFHVSGISVVWQIIGRGRALCRVAPDFPLTAAS